VSLAKASEDARIPPRSGDRGFLRRRVTGRFVEKHGNTLPSEPIPRHMATPGWDPNIRSSTDGTQGLIEALSLKVGLYDPKKQPAGSLFRFTPLGNGH